MNHIQPLPQLLDLTDHHQGRSTLGGFFKPKYRDYPRDNVHRTSEKEHKQVIDNGTNRHRPSINLHRDLNLYKTDIGGGGKLPRTQFPILPYDADTTSSRRQQRRRDSSGGSDRDSSPEMSHDKYLPRVRKSPRPRSPRLSPRYYAETAFDGKMLLPAITLSS